jgi:hypothetical protein
LSRHLAAIDGPRSTIPFVSVETADLTLDGRLLHSPDGTTVGGDVNKFVLASVLAFACPLAGCGGSQSTGFSVLDTAGLKNSKRAALVMSSSAPATTINLFMTQTPVVTMRWRLRGAKADDALAQFETGSADTPSKPAMREVRAGIYDMVHFTYQVHRTKISSNPLVPSMAHLEVQAGEVVYAGHIRVVLSDSDRSFKLALENHEQQARGVLNGTKHDLGTRMQTRLVTISPLFAVTP